MESQKETLRPGLSGSAPSAAEVSEYLDRLFRHPSFRVSARRVRLLRYLAHRTLAGEADHINEYAIAIDVFEKPIEFDPKLDATVRAEVSRLRRNLGDYYANAGQTDPLRITLAPRGYFLLFTPIADRVPPPQPQTERGESPHRASAKRRSKFAMPIVLAAIMFGILAALAALYLRPAPRPPALSFAVLPASIAPSAVDLRDLAAPITDVFTDSLRRVTGASVLGPWMVADFKGPNAFKEARGRLQVALILQTTIERENGRLAAKLSLRRRLDGNIVWSSNAPLPWVDETHWRAAVETVAQSSIQAAAERETYYLANSTLEALTAKAPFPGVADDASPCSAGSGAALDPLKRDAQLTVTVQAYGSHSYSIRIPLRVGGQSYSGYRATVDVLQGKPILVRAPQLVQTSSDTCVRAGYSGTLPVYRDGCVVPATASSEIAVNYFCSAKADPIDLGKWTGGDKWYPAFLPSGAVLLGDVPFVIPEGAERFWRGQFRSQGSARPVSLTLPVDRFSVSTAYFLLNTEWGQPGPESYLTLVFVGDRGARFEKRLIGGVDIRDYHQGIYTNTINGTTSRAVFDDGRGNRMDLVEVRLPPEFHSQILRNITLSDTGRFGFQRAILWGLTVR